MGKAHLFHRILTVSGSIFLSGLLSIWMAIFTSLNWPESWIKFSFSGLALVLSAVSFFWISGSGSIREIYGRFFFFLFALLSILALHLWFVVIPFTEDKLSEVAKEIARSKSPSNRSELSEIESSHSAFLFFSFLLLFFTLVSAFISSAMAAILHFSKEKRKES
ncbi:hypothetical protein ACE5IS_17565 [Leptospira wolffii]|uniref:DUF4199 domain-containing protein n=1 Tax=Leptospira wolffii TaxID=409998 RepID=A0ABV5BRZ1_9LEPT|nr:hypothetical protein [Leptospira wolffii]TGL51823.1 hypothetical protein EHQ61_07630 [Leptospira wolffii]